MVLVSQIKLKERRMAQSSQQEQPHAIMICYPLQGHINPFVDLAIKLASKGFTITFVHTQYVHQQISQANKQDTTIEAEEATDIFAEPRKSGLDIRYATISDGLPLEFDRDLNIWQYIESVFYDFPSHVDELVGKIVQSDPSSTAFVLIADTFQSWTAAIASKYNLVSVSFWTQPALTFTIYYHLDLLREHGHIPFTGDQEEDINCIPGVKSISTRHLTSYLRASDLTTFVHKVIFKAFEDVKKADFILHNTVQELEPEVLSALNQNQPTIAIGPVLPTNAASTSYNVARSLLSESDCTHWLNNKPRGSVLYVSFGSLARLEKSDFMEIAYGLLISEVNFLWVIRPGVASLSDDDPSLAEISDSARGRGLIVPWCNQNVVLSNSAIGGFLTHGGWNSVLESLHCGVPLICYPFFADQVTNRALVVENWKVGINLFDDEMPISREEVAEKIKSLMIGETSDGLRQEAKKVARLLNDALSPNGSSERNLDQFVKEVKAQIQKRGVSSA